VLLPGVTTPYRVFEPRYRALVQDLLARPEQERWLSVPRLDQRPQSDVGEAFATVATVARMTHCSPQDDGEFHILVEAIARCRLNECPSEHDYRLAGVEPLPDVEDQTTEARLSRALETIAHGVFSLATRVGDPIEDLLKVFAREPRREYLLYRLGAAFVHDGEDRQRFLETRCPASRADLVIAAIAEVLAMTQD